jgi:hypothetical protein
LIHDRDPLFTAEFLEMLADIGIQSVKLPPRSPTTHPSHVAAVCISEMLLVVARRNGQTTGGLSKPLA